MSVENDVATVLALEAPVNAAVKALQEAAAAIERLSGSGYPGAGNLSDEIAHPEGVERIGKALEIMRVASGDQAAWDHHFYVGQLGLTLGDAAKEIIEASNDDNANLRRVEAMRQYAATVA